MFSRCDLVGMTNASPEEQINNDMLTHGVSELEIFAWHANPLTAAFWAGVLSGIGGADLKLTNAIGPGPWRIYRASKGAGASR